MTPRLNIQNIQPEAYKAMYALEKYMAGKESPHQAKDGVTIDNVEYKVHDD